MMGWQAADRTERVMRKGKQAGAVVWYPERGQWFPGRVFYVTAAHPRNPLLGIRSVTDAGVRLTVARRASKVRTRNPRAAR
jgi:hypothetical protein